MTGPVFVDINVIVYRYDTRVPAKQSRADEWLKLVWSSRSGWKKKSITRACYHGPEVQRV